MRLLRWLVGALVILMLASCKITLNMVEENGKGKVEHRMGICRNSSYEYGPNCSQSTDVVDFYFRSTYAAIPAGGYKFKHWKKGDRRLCGGSDKTCHIDMTVFTGAWIPIIQPFLDNMDEEFFIEPVFEKIASAVPCSVYADDGQSPFCAEGKLPTCKITQEKVVGITKGMTYSEVVKHLGCHGHFYLSQIYHFVDADYRLIYEKNWGGFYWGTGKNNATEQLRFAYDPSVNDEPTLDDIRHF